MVASFQGGANCHLRAFRRVSHPSNCVAFQVSAELDENVVPLRGGLTNFQISIRASSDCVSEATKVRGAPLYVAEVTVSRLSLLMETPTSIRRSEPEVVCEMERLEVAVKPDNAASTKGTPPGWDVGSDVGVSVAGSPCPPHWGGVRGFI